MTNQSAPVAASTGVIVTVTFTRRSVLTSPSGATTTLPGPTNDVRIVAVERCPWRGYGTASPAITIRPAATSTGTGIEARFSATMRPMATPSAPPATATSVAIQIALSNDGSHGTRPNRSVHPHSVASPAAPAARPASAPRTAGPRLAATAQTISITIAAPT